MEDPTGVEDRQVYSIERRPLGIQAIGHCKLPTLLALPSQGGEISRVYGFTQERTRGSGTSEADSGGAGAATSELPKGS